MAIVKTVKVGNATINFSDDCICPKDQQKRIWDNIEKIAETALMEKDVRFLQKETA